MPPSVKSQPKPAQKPEVPSKVAPVAAAPAPATAGGKKAVAKPVVAKAATPAPAVAKAAAAPVVAAPAQKAGAKPKKAPVVEVVAAPAQKAGKKAAAAPKVAKAPKAKKVVAEAEEAEAEGDEAKGVRSFKVQLPGTEEYSGRFTGLTPYQAANKALSKFFRENKTAKAEITFSIRESTRGSKRSTYTYNGKREKLAIPVKYSIKSSDGEAREIVKEYKNRLIKVKKADVKEVVA